MDMNKFGNKSFTTSIYQIREIERYTIPKSIGVKKQIGTFKFTSVKVHSSLTKIRSLRPSTSFLVWEKEECS